MFTLSEKEVEQRLKEYLRPKDVPFHEEDLLDGTVQWFLTRIRLLKTLDTTESLLQELFEERATNLEGKHLLEEFTMKLSFGQEYLRLLLEEFTPVYEENILRHDIADKLLTDQINKYYTKFPIEYERLHFPENRIFSFASVRRTVEEGQRQVGIPIGPEGFPYASMFDLFNFSLRHVYIDEYCKTEDRPYQELDNLQDIQGKDVIFIEDDVVSGKTLAKAAQKISTYKPKSIAVYLGTPEDKQELQNIPPNIRPIYTTPSSLKDPEIKTTTDVALARLAQHYKIFKSKVK